MKYKVGDIVLIRSIREGIFGVLSGSSVYNNYAKITHIVFDEIRQVYCYRIDEHDSDLAHHWFEEEIKCSKIEERIIKLKKLNKK